MKQFLFLILLTLSVAPAFAQSANQDFPTPVVTNEIGGVIRARDIGDARLTRHFYTFYADNGDLSLKIETSNLDGDIDLFEAKTLRPLSKIPLYSGNSAITTNRIVYFRQRRQVILRVEGRTPNDDPASYQIALSGSFVAGTDLPQPPEDLEAKVEDRTGGTATARVNSAGAIMEVLPPKQKPAPPVQEVLPVEEKTTEEIAKAESPATVKPDEETVTAAPKTPAGRRTPARRRTRAATTTGKPKAETTASASRRRPSSNASATARRTSARKPAAAAETPKVDPLASVRLLIVLKDGYKIERPMSEISRVSVDRGQLLVVAKTGKIERFAILDVLKMSIEQ